MADQQGSDDGAWGLDAGRESEVVEAVTVVTVVVSEPELVLRLISAVVVVVVEAKLRL